MATYVQAKRREGVLDHFPSHVGLHFRRELAASSFEGSFLFAEDVLARVTVSFQEDSHLDAQLSRSFEVLIGRPPPISVSKPLPPLPQALGVREVLFRKARERSASLLLGLRRVELLRLRSVPLPQSKGSEIFASRGHVPVQQ